MRLQKWQGVLQDHLYALYIIVYSFWVLLTDQSVLYG